jgi:hypothetical protein
MLLVLASPVAPHPGVFFPHAPVLKRVYTTVLLQSSR